jgi:YHS domain-containing protein
MKTAFLLLTLMIMFDVHAQTDALRTKHFNTKKSLALDGYDPVSYFDGPPREGVNAFTYKHKGISYQFINAENLNKFKLNPEKYEPAYGGWCAYAMGETGEKVKVDPETFKIIDGRVYLFYNFWGNNTLEDWSKNEKKLKQAADRNWNKSVQL